MQIASFSLWSSLIFWSVAVIHASASDACEPEQMSVLQVKGEQNASNPMVKRWQDVASTIERLKVKLDEDELDEDELDEEEENAWEGDQAKDKKNQKDKKDQKGKKDQKDKKNQKNKKDQKDKRRVAAKAANRAFTKVVPAIQACVSAAPGKCDSVAIWTGVSNGVAELGPLIKAFTKYGQYVPMIGNIVGLVGSLLGLLVGNAPGKSPAPISIDDMRNVVSQELYTFKMSEQGWKLKGALVAVNHLLRNYGDILNEPAIHPDWFKKNLVGKQTYVFSMLDHMVQTWYFMVGAGDSHRSQMAKLSPFKSSCRQGQTIFERGTVKNSFNKVTRNVESCAYETNAENQNKCRQEADQAARDWNTLNMALGHWKAVADAMDHLRFVMESIVQKGGRCCFEGGAGQACKEDCDTWNEWRSKFQDISDAAERLKTNHDILKGPSCAAKPAVPWALAQTSTSCPDKFHCNYGYMAVACREKCPNGMAQLWHGKGTNKVSKYVEQNCAKEVHMHKQSAGWKYATKTSIANNGQMTAPDAGQEKTDFRFWCSSGLCGTRARHLSLCAQRNYCVEQPCLNFFTDDKAWTVW